MDERSASSNGPASEAIATTGLFLNIASVIAIAMSLASWGAANAALAVAAGIAAVLTFVASLICFGLQADDREPQQLA